MRLRIDRNRQETPKERVEFTQLDQALNGDLDAAQLNAPTRAEYDRITEDGPVQPGEPSEADFVHEDYWEKQREREAAVGAKREEVGEGPELDEFVASL